MNYKRVFIQDSYVFLTVVTNNRKNLLIENIDLLNAAFKNTKTNYNFDIIAFVLLPDHFHLIIKPNNIFEYPKIISSIKHCFSKNFNVVGQVCPTYDRSKGIWQRRYFEHTIISEDDLHNHINYIHYNPVKHKHAKAPKDWEHSSFDKFVKAGNYDVNWGTTQDIQKIKELDYE